MCVCVRKRMYRMFPVHDSSFILFFYINIFIGRWTEFYHTTLGSWRHRVSSAGRWPLLHTLLPLFRLFPPHHRWLTHLSALDRAVNTTHPLLWEQVNLNQRWRSPQFFSPSSPSNQFLVLRLRKAFQSDSVLLCDAGGLPRVFQPLGGDTASWSQCSVVKAAVWNVCLQCLE